MKNLGSEGGLSDEEGRKREQAFDIEFRKSTEFCDPEDVEYFLDYMSGQVNSYIDSSDNVNLRVCFDKAVADLCANPRFIESVSFKKLNKEGFLKGLRILFARLFDGIDSEKTQDDSPELFN